MIVSCCVAAVNNGVVIHAGELIEVLDISLRRSPMRTARHVTPPDDYRNYNSLLYQSGSSHSTSAIAQLSTPHHPKGSRSPSLPPQPPPLSPPSVDPNPPESDPEDFRHHRQRSKSHDGTRRARVYVNVSPRPPTSPKHAQSMSCSLTRQARKERSKVVPQRSKRGGMVGDYESSSSPLGAIPPPRITTKLRKDSTSSEDSSPLSTLMSQEGIESIQASSTKRKGASLKNGMTRSFRYRRVALRQEKPIVTPIQEVDSSDDEDDETETEYDSCSLSSKRSLARSSPNLSGAGRRHYRKHGKSPNSPQLKPSYEVDESHQLTLYSKVTVVGVKVSNVTEPHRRPHLYSVDHDSDHEDSSYRRESDTFPLPPPSPNDAVFAEFETASNSSKHRSDTTLLNECASLNSLDKILEPPPMFEDPDDQLQPLPPPAGSDTSHQVTYTYTHTLLYVQVNVILITHTEQVSSSK